MQIEYEKSCISEYMILDVLDEYKDKFAEKMLLRAAIPGLLAVDKRYFNGIEKYYYCTDSYISIEDYYKERTMSVNDVHYILMSLSQIFASLSEYLLDGRNLMLTPAAIYKKIDEDKLAFCFYPGSESKMPNSIMDFALFMMEHADSEDSDGVAIVYEYYEMVDKGIYDPVNILKKYHGSFEIKEEEEKITIHEDKEDYDKETFYFAEPQLEEEIDDNREILFPLTVCAIIILLSSVVYVYVFLHPKLLAFIGIAQESYLVIGAAMAFVLSIILFFIVKLYLKKAERVELETEAIEETEYKRRMRQGDMERLEYERRAQE